MGRVVSSTPRPHFTAGKDPVPILQEAGWAPGPVWTGGKPSPQRDSISDRPVHNSVAIPTELLVYELYRYQNARYNDKKRNIAFNPEIKTVFL